MGYNNEHLPNEAEMDLEDFGPKQVRNYILHAAHKIFIGDKHTKGECLMRVHLGYQPKVVIEEDETMTVAVSSYKIRLRKMDNGRWHYVLNDDITQVRVFDAKDVFKMIEAVLGMVLHAEFDLYLMHHYECMA